MGEGATRSMDKLSLTTTGKKSSGLDEAVVDSWEDERSGSEEESLNDQAREKPTHLAKPSMSYPSAPPPTPMSPQFSNMPAPSNVLESASRSQRDSGDPRPEKTTQTASRMIAAGLGVRAPKRTEEEREYDRALRENERKRLSKQKEEKRKQEEERENAKKAMWDD